MRLWLLIAGLSVAATLGGSFAGFEADRAWLWTEPWRLWSGPLRHADAAHLLRDLTGLLGLALLMRGRLSRRQLGALLALGLPLPVVGALLGDPAAGGYYGISGLVHALCAAALVDLARTRPRWAALLASLLVAKLAFELSTGALWFALDGGRPAVWGHATGVALGLIVAGWRPGSDPSAPEQDPPALGPAPDLADAGQVALQGVGEGFAGALRQAA